MNWSIKAHYERMLEKQNALNRSAQVSRENARDAWNQHVVGLIENHFELAKTAMQKTGLFEAAYVSRSDEHRQIQLFLGRHPIGPKGLEAGAAATVSQSETGEVIFLLYPYTSYVRTRLKPHIVWYHTEYPMTVKAALIEDFIEDFMIYVRVSSALFVPSASDRRRVDRLEARSRSIESFTPQFPGKWAKCVLFGASALVFAFFIIWLVMEKSWCEPAIGLTALIAGWLAAWIKEIDDRVQRVKVREEAARIATDRRPTETA